MLGRLRKTGGSVIAMIIAPVLAQNAPPELPLPNMSWPARSTAAPAAHLRLGELALRFEATTLSAVAEAAGVGTVYNQGDAGASVYWLCYTIASGSSGQRIWISSHGEMGGRDHLVTRVTAEVLAPSVGPTADCPALPATLQPVSFEHDVWLGLPETAALRILGQPSYREGSWTSFNYRGKVPGNGNCAPDGFDLASWLVFRTMEGRIVAITAQQIASC